jgi:lipopolysaccharide transport system permease protein
MLTTFFALTDTIARFDLKAEASKLYLSYLWWIVEPLLYVLVFYVVFGVLLKIDRGNYVLFLLCGKVPFLWFSKSVQNAATSIVANKGLIGQVEIRKTLFPYVAVVEALYKQWAVFALLFSIVWIMGFAPGLNWFWLLPLIAVQLTLTILCSLVAALLVCFVPDTRFFVALGITFLLFVSGIFFDVADVADERARNLLLTLNPLAFLIAAYRTVLLDGGVYDVRHLALIGLASLLGVALVHYVYARLDRVIASRVLNQ